MSVPGTSNHHDRFENYDFQSIYLVQPENCDSFGDTDDIAFAAIYLASEEAKFVTGQTLSPNGGFVMSQ